MTRMLASAAALLAFALAGCGPSGSPPPSQSAADSPAPGEQTSAPEEGGNNTYHIAAYGITVTAPEGWHVADSELMDKIMDMGLDVTKSNMDTSSKAVIDSAMKRGGPLFTFSEFPPGAPRDSNAMLMAVSEDVSAGPGIVRGTDYFFHTRRLLAQSPVPTTISDAYSERLIDGQSFDRMDMMVGPPGREISQRMYARRHDDHMVLFVQAYQTDEQLATLDAALNGIKLDW